jgi:hypothetical protein
MRGDCIFDVGVTGEVGFGKTYGNTQNSRPGAVKAVVTSTPATTRSGEPAVFTARITQESPRGAKATSGSVQFFIDKVKSGSALPIDASGEAKLSTSSLSIGKHHVAAEFLPPPSGWGVALHAALSRAIEHDVVAAGGGGGSGSGEHWNWMMILLVVAAILVAIWLLMKLI